MRITLLCPFLLVLSLLLSYGARSLSAQETGLSNPERQGRLRGVAYVGDGSGEVTGISGWLIERTDSLLTIDDGRELHNLRRSSISHIDLFLLPNDDLPAALFAGGAFLAGQILVLSENGAHPDRYRSANSTYTRTPLFPMLGVGLAGGVAGGTITSFIVRGIDEKRERIEIDYGRNETGWDRLGSRMTSATRSFSIQVTTAGLLDLGSGSVLLERQQSGGNDFEGGGQSGVLHQWFRRLRLGYGISGSLDVGLTLANPSLPRYDGNFIIPHIPADFLRTRIETAVQGIAVAPSIGIYPGGRGSGPEFGVGVGLASIGFYERTTTPHEVTREIVVDSIEESSLYPIGLLDADYAFYVTDGLSVNLTVDLMLLPSLTPPPRAVGKEQEPEDIPLTSGSVGVSVGYWF